MRTEYLLRLADDALILSHRLAEWAGRAPQIEEDIALTNIGLDLLGQARALLTRAGELEGAGRDEDDFAYLREEHDFRCCLLVEQPNARRLRGHHGPPAAVLRLPTPAVAGADDLSTDRGGRHRRQGREGGALPPRARRRLGDPAGRRHRRVAPPHAGRAGLAVALYRRTVRVRRRRPRRSLPAGSAWTRRRSATRGTRTVDTVLAEATLARPAAEPRPGTGRRGVHSEHLGYLLAEMQYLHRLHPGAAW